MKLIILISATHEGEWGELIQPSKETMGKQQHDNVELFYVFAGGKRGFKGNEYYSGTKGDYSLQHLKGKRAIKDLMKKEWDFVLCGSQSSYFDFRLCYEKCLTLPIEKCYCGVDGVGYASGCGFFMSRDVAKLYLDVVPNTECVDGDALIGSMLRRNGIKVTQGAQRVQYNHVTHKMSRCYHYRCKVDAGMDKMNEAIAFKNIYEDTCFYD